MSERKLFGTDGIRGKANVYPMTSEVATALGRAVTYYFQKKSGNEKRPLVIVGKDTRLSCYMIEQAFASGVCSQGGRVIFTGPLPTPGVAFVTDSMRADAGVMISASHNSFDDNGIKIFDANGFKLPDEVELLLEDLVLNPEKMPQKTGSEIGRAKRLEGVDGRYIVHVKTALTHEHDMSGMRVVVDCANGASYKVAPMVLSELGAEVFSIGVSPNGENINLNCGSLHPEVAKEEVTKLRADIGFCLDGDADRIQVIDKHGQVIDGDKLIGIFAKLMLDKGDLKKGDTVVGTVMSNIGLELYLQSLGLNFHRTKVGDRYIMEYMRENKAKLGGEPSGHIIFTDHATTGDGTLAALKTVEAMKHFKKDVDQLASEIELFPQVLKNITVGEKKPLDELELLQAAIKEANEKLAGRGRVVIRYSGTESLARVMVEGDKRELVNDICDNLITVLKKELG
ncbi:phosphoglucosamine mutase [Bacteriovorax sp. DB6_IX]|uniref:phosphoglucosamine mutase n=1 Tax=Bacteriovorax sp. DB6_IX TaxID=1353530 RepID=UPI00038A40D6|nr:phosphoglucosamine mutase [Bacteriovorax sp. DB6_IX]EQC51886.1 phosphoglucosamine mutase [Bacteriovorax sp. DB6_IX]